MRRGNWLEKVFQIRKGEGLPILSLMALSYFIGWALALYYITSTTIFLQHFDSGQLPLAYTLAGVAGYLGYWALSKMDLKLGLFSQLKIKLGIVLVSILAFSLWNWLSPSPVMAFAMFIWFRVLAFISVVVFWGVAGRLFDLRQGKRIFGLISTGEVLSDVIGFFSIPLLLNYMGYTELLFLASFSMLACLFTLIIIIKKFGKQLAPPQAKPVYQKEEKKEKPFWQYLREPYFRYLFALALLPIFGIMFIDYMFLDQTKIKYSDPEVLGNFLSIFFGAVAVIELLLKFFVSGRFINKYGLKPGLLSLPIALLACATLASISGGLYGEGMLFFSFIILSKLADRSVRSAIYDPSFQILYQPLPAEERIDFQNKTEGIPKAFGNIAAGLTLMFLTFIGLTNLVYFNFIFLIIAAAWVWLTLRLYREYREMIKSVLMGKSGGEYQLHSFLKTGSYFFKELIFSPISRKSISTLNLMEKLEPISREDYYRKLLAHANARIRKEVVARIGLHRLVSMLLDIDAMLEKEKDKNVLETLQQIRSELVRVRQHSSSDLQQMAEDPDPEVRNEAAIILGQLPRLKVSNAMRMLLQDDDPNVRTNALLSAGKIRNRDLWPYLLDNLSDPRYSNIVCTALIEIGEPILADLDRLFSQRENDRETQYKIIRTIGRIGGKKAIWLLKNRIHYPVDNIRHHILLSLSNMGYSVLSSEVNSVKGAIEYDISNMLWTMAAIRDLKDVNACTTLVKALNNELVEKTERVFLLLSLLYDSQAMKKIRDIILSGTANERVFAIEIIDMLVDESIKQILIPLVESSGLSEPIRVLRYHFPQEDLSTSERLKDIVNRDYSTINQWTRACAIKAIGELGLSELADVVVSCIKHPDFLVRQEVMFTLEQTEPSKIEDYLERLKKEERISIEKELEPVRENRSSNGLLAVSQKVEYLKTLEIFNGFPEVFLVEIARLAHYFKVDEEQAIQKDESSKEMFRVVEGTIQGITNKKKPKVFAENELISEMDYGTADWNNLQLKAEKKSGLLRIPQEPLFEAISNHVFLAKHIATYIDNK